MAIAFDTAVDGGLGIGVTSLTWSHTCTGATILWVGVFGDTVAVDATGNNLTGVTYNGVAMTEKARLAENNGATPPSDRWLYIFVLASPASGANNVIASGGVGMIIGGLSASYSGAATTGIPDNSAQTFGVGMSATATLTPVASNCWAVFLTKNNFGAASASTGSTLRISSGNGIGIFDSNGTISGSTSMSVTFGGSAEYAGLMDSFAPSGGGGSRGLFQPSPLSGLGSGGSGYFRDPLAAPLLAPQNFVRKDRIYVPARLAA